MKSRLGGPKTSKPNAVTLNGVPIKDFTSKGLDPQKPIRKPLKKVSKPKPVTLNGVPLENFPAKGLEKVAGINEIKDHGPSSIKPTGTLSSKEVTTNAQKASGEALSSKQSPTEKKSTTKSISQKSEQSQPAPKTATTKEGSKVPGKLPLKGSEPQSKANHSKKTHEVNKQSANLLQNKNIKPKPATNSETSSTAPTAPSSVAGDEGHADSAQIRKARKKLELQGKQMPKRKIRRAVGTTAQ